MFASAMMICVTNTLVFATEEIASAADMIFFAAEKIISVIGTSVCVRSTILFVASTLFFVGEMIISVGSRQGTLKNRLPAIDSARALDLVHPGRGFRSAAHPQDRVEKRGTITSGPVSGLEHRERILAPTLWFNHGNKAVAAAIRQSLEQAGIRHAARKVEAAVEY